jgi:hypothetical protein
MSKQLFIVNKCLEFSKKQNMKILEFIQDLGIKITECADGCRVNLDILEDEQLDLIINKINNTVEKVEPRFKIE